MRRKARDELARMLDEILIPIVENRLNPAVIRILQRIHEADDGVITAIQQIQPANVELDQELADRIVEKLHGPLTIPAEMSQWVKDEAQYHDMQSFHRLGYSKMAADVQWTLQVNGTIRLEIRRVDGSRWWSGTFVPPDFGKAP